MPSTSYIPSNGVAFACPVVNHKKSIALIIYVPSTFLFTTGACFAFFVRVVETDFLSLTAFAFGSPVAVDAFACVRDELPKKSSSGAGSEVAAFLVCATLELCTWWVIIIRVPAPRRYHSWGEGVQRNVALTGTEPGQAHNHSLIHSLARSLTPRKTRHIKLNRNRRLDPIHSITNRLC